jgi:3-mercaptopyruvate sulfurtransferase SseA
MDLIDRESNRFVDEGTISDVFAASGALEAERVVVYCGGGIFATKDTVAFSFWVGRMCSYTMVR